MAFNADGYPELAQNYCKLPRFQMEFKYKMGFKSQT